MTRNIARLTIHGHAGLQDHGAAAAHGRRAGRRALWCGNAPVLARAEARRDVVVAQACRVDSLYCVRVRVRDFVTKPCKRACIDEVQHGFMCRGPARTASESAAAAQSNTFSESTIRTLACAGRRLSRGGFHEFLGFCGLLACAARGHPAALRQVFRVFSRIPPLTAHAVGAWPPLPRHAVRPRPACGRSHNACRSTDAARGKRVDGKCVAAAWRAPRQLYCGMCVQECFARVACRPCAD